MFRPRTIIGGIALGLGFFVALIYGHPASATERPTRPAPCCVNADWYVNPDETTLKPQQFPDGMLFDGPSLIHHHVAPPVALSAAPLDGAFGAHVFHGVAPLFKMETATPYSTINKTAAGKYWSSKIATGAGSQSMPLATLSGFVGLWNYTSSTVIYSFGVGYANDQGNKAFVSWVSFGGHKYSLGCPHSPSPSASATPSATPTSTPSTTPTATPSATPPPTTPGPTATTPGPTPTGSIVPTPPPTTDQPPPVTPIAGDGGAGGLGTGGQLAKTGYDTTGLAWIGAALILSGALLGLVAWRRRRVRFSA